MITHLEDLNHWTINGEILSQESFMKNNIKCIQCHKWLLSTGKRCICEDCMPNRNGEFAIYCQDHFKTHKIQHPKHILQKQSFVGISWTEDKKEPAKGKTKCSV